MIKQLLNIIYYQEEKYGSRYLKKKRILKNIKHLLYE